MRLIVYFGTYTFIAYSISKNKNQFNPKKSDKLNNTMRFKFLPWEAFKEVAGDVDINTVADLGAGTGFYAKEWTKLFPGSRVIALDISDFMIDIMKNIYLYF